MPKVIFKEKNKQVQISPGDSVLKAAQKGRVALSQRCGGKGSCTTCKVIIEPKFLPFVSSPNPIELRMVSEANLKQGERLGCQVKVYGDIEIKQPEDRLKAIIQAQLQKSKNDDK